MRLGKILPGANQLEAFDVETPLWHLYNGGLGKRAEQEFKHGSVAAGIAQPFLVALRPAPIK